LNSTRRGEDIQEECLADGRGSVQRSPLSLSFEMALAPLCQYVEPAFSIYPLRLSMAMWALQQV
jgi:hypothetical protein